MLVARLDFDEYGELVGSIIFDGGNNYSTERMEFMDNFEESNMGEFDQGELEYRDGVLIVYEDWGNMFLLVELHDDEVYELNVHAEDFEFEVVDEAKGQLVDPDVNWLHQEEVKMDEDRFSIEEIRRRHRLYIDVRPGMKAERFDMRDLYNDE